MKILHEKTYETNSDNIAFIREVYKPFGKITLFSLSQSEIVFLCRILPPRS
jgi:hypothetical protein